MITIFKQKLFLEREQIVKAPPDAEFLHAAFQDDSLCVWYRLDEEKDFIDHSIIICGTGHEAPHEGWKHISTVLTPDHRFVWHVFVAT